MKQEEEQPIQISDDEEQPMQVEHPVTTIIKGNTSFDIQYAYCSEETKQLQQKEVHILSRIQRFFKERKFIETGKEHIKPRKQPNYYNENVHAVGNEIIIFGVDFCKQKLFTKQYKPSIILTINQSNWKLIYSTKEEAWAALRQNCKDPTQLVTKMQQEDDPVPRCWFQMKPFIFYTHQISVCARFATNEQLKFEPKDESKFEIYKIAKCIYNEKEQRRKEQMIEHQVKEKQKIERRNNRNSQNLYKQFQKQAGEDWKQGRNRKNGLNNDRAMENDRERSRSRDKEHKNRTSPKEREKEAANKDDVESNYSFLMSKSKNDAKELMEIFNDLNFEEKDQNKQEKQNLNLVEAGAQLPQIQTNINKNEYNWGGNCSQSTRTGYKWSYKGYILQQQREEEMRKQKLLIEVISIDD